MRPANHARIDAAIREVEGPRACARTADFVLVCEAVAFGREYAAECDPSTRAGLFVVMDAGASGWERSSTYGRYAHPTTQVTVARRGNGAWALVHVERGPWHRATDISWRDAA